jgi:hypothetical protein
MRRVGRKTPILVSQTDIQPDDAMGRDPDQEMPDPFSTATVQDASAQPAAEAKTETAPQRYVLPKNLRNAVKHLSDGELDLMHAATVEEMRRRGRTPSVETDLPVCPDMAKRPSPPTENDGTSILPTSL